MERALGLLTAAPAATRRARGPRLGLWACQAASSAASAEASAAATAGSSSHRRLLGNLYPSVFSGVSRGWDVQLGLAGTHRRHTVWVPLSAAAVSSARWSRLSPALPTSAPQPACARRRADARGWSLARSRLASVGVQEDGWEEAKVC